MGPCYPRSQLASGLSFPGPPQPQRADSPIAGRAGHSFRGLPAPGPRGCLRRAHFLSFERPAGGDEDRGLRAVRTKVNRKSASPLWAGPRLFPNRTPAKEYCTATEPPRFGWPLVIGAVVVLLRLPALGMIGTSCRAKRIDESVSLTGRQPKLDEIPATDQIPEGPVYSVAPHHLNLIKSD